MARIHPRTPEQGELRVRVTLTSGSVVEGICSEREYVEARYDLGRHSPRPDSRIYILNVIAHPADIENIERI